MHLGCFKEHLSLIHGDLVGAGLWSAKENDVFIREGLQRLGLSSLVDGHIFSAHTQPEIMREASFFALERHKHMGVMNIFPCVLAARDAPIRSAASVPRLMPTMLIGSDTNKRCVN